MGHRTEADDDLFAEDHRAGRASHDGQHDHRHDHARRRLVVRVGKKVDLGMGMGKVCAGGGSTLGLALSLSPP